MIDKTSEQQYSLAYICNIIDVSDEHYNKLQIHNIAPVESASDHTISYLASDKLKFHLLRPGKRAIIVSKERSYEYHHDVMLLPVDNVMDEWCKVVRLFYPEENTKADIHESAQIDQSVKVAQNVSIAALTIIKSGSVVGKDSFIHEHVLVGKNVTIGANCIIHSGVKIYSNTVIGDHVVINANAVIGSDGFGYYSSHGKYKKIPHLGRVVIENEVEIGANTCIDRGVLGDTVIGAGSKLDNLIHVAHNVSIGTNTAIAAQSGISGSTTIGNNVRLGGQTGIVGHITVADGSQVQAQSGVSGSITEKSKKWYGYPAIAYWTYLRAFSIFKKLPELVRKIDKLEKRISRIDKVQNL